MDYKYGYGDLEDQLLTVFLSRTPDFAVAEDLIAKGADVNAESKNPDENMLSEIIFGCCWPPESLNENEERTDFEEECNFKPINGQTMVKIIRFFLDHGFDVSKAEGWFGAQCLAAIVHSSFDAYMIEATKVLFDAGAKNIKTSSEVGEIPKDLVGSEGSFQDTFCRNHHLGNIYEAIYQIYLAVEEKRPYNGIESYEASCGKRILRVFAEKPESGDVFFDMNLTTSQHKNCYRQALYFVFDGGILVTTRFADFWVDSMLPNIALINVSERFPGIVGSTIKRFTFGHNEIFKGIRNYGQPITNIEMDSGVKVRFSTNYGEADDENRVAYYCLMKDKA